LTKDLTLKNFSLGLSLYIVQWGGTKDSEIDKDQK